MYLFGAKAQCWKIIQQAATLLQQYNWLLPPQENLFGLPVVSVSEHGDFILGLLWYLKNEPDPHKKAQAARILKNVVLALVEHFSLGQQTKSFYLPWLRTTIPVFESQDGIFMEFDDLNLPHIFNRKSIINLFRQYIYLCQCSNLGLPTNLTPINPKIKQYFRYFNLKTFERLTFIKHVSNPIYGMLSLFNHTHDRFVLYQLEKSIEKILKYFFTPDGFIFHTIDVGNKSAGKIHSASSHTAIDLFSYLAYFLKKSYYLNIAEQIASNWLKIQGATGLFPVSPTVKYSDLDSQTDMIIALNKLGQLSRRKKYLLAADRALNGVLTHHWKNNGLVLSCEINNGDCINGQFKTKFIALFLKVLYFYEHGGKIFPPKTLYENLKDR